MPPMPYVQMKLLTMPAALGPLGDRVGYLKEIDRGLVKPIRADYVEYSIALELRIHRLALVVDRRQAGRGKITRQLVRSGNRAYGIGGRADHLTLAAEEEECLVLPYRAADCRSELILNERCTWKSVKVGEKSLASSTLLRRYS